MQNYRFYGLSRKKFKIINELEIIDERFKVVEEVNPLQFMLKFQDRVYLKTVIILKNNMILEIIYNQFYISVFQPIKPGERRTLILKRLKYKKSREIIEEIKDITNNIEGFYL